MDGVISLIKPPGITSHDAIGICRRILKERRIGHSGTLDPLAYGVLPIFVGKATRAIEYTESIGKTYVAECKFGVETDTEDSTGNILERMGLFRHSALGTIRRSGEVLYRSYGATTVQVFCYQNQWATRL